MTGAASALAKLTTPRIDTRQSERRPVALATLEDLSREIDTIEVASRPESQGIRVTGNWSAGQIFEHLCRAIERSLDGFSAQPASERPVPGGLRAITGRAEQAAAAAGERALRARMLASPMVPRGPSVALPGELEPPAHAWTIDGANRLRQTLARLRDGHPMSKPSPTLGRLSQEEWMTFHLRHAELHVSFIILGQRR